MHWQRSEVWQVQTDKYCVEIKHWFSGDENKWNVYAYIYKTNPLFESMLADKSMWGEESCLMPFHGGPTYRREYQDDEGNASCVVVGSDYYHDGDHYYTTLETAEDAYSVFRDAEHLVAYLDQVIADMESSDKE